MNTEANSPATPAAKVYVDTNKPNWASEIAKPVLMGAIILASAFLKNAP
jgi:hypothetical protein